MNYLNTQKLNILKKIANDEEIILRNININSIPENVKIYKFNEYNNKLTKIFVTFKFFSSKNMCDLYYKLSYAEQIECPPLLLYVFV